MAFFGLQLAGERLAEFAVLGVDLHFLERRDVPRLVRAFAGLEPVMQVGAEVFVGEILAPEGRVFHARFRERAVEIEHADEAGPGARPIGNRENRPAVRDQSAEHVVRILPDRLGYDDGRFGVNVGEDFHAFLLRGDEAVLLFVAVLMGADDGIAFRFDGLSEGVFHLLLSGPAFLIGGKPKVAAGDEVHFFFSKSLWLCGFAVFRALRHGCFLFVV